MSFIEGIGDEVVLFFIIICVFVLAALITFIGYIPHSRTVVERHEFVLNEQNEGIIHLPVLFSSTSLDDNIGFNVNSEPPLRNRSRIRENEDGNHSDLQLQEERREPEGQPADVSRTEGDGGGAEECPTERDQRGTIRVRLKYLDDTERVVTTKLSEKVIDFKQRHFAESIGDGRVVRLIFAGRLLQDQTTLQGCRVQDHSVVHVQVLQEPGGPARIPDSELDVGRMLVPLLTVILCMCWVTYSRHPELFTPLSLGILLSLSGFFFYFVYRTRH